MNITTAQPVEANGTSLRGYIDISYDDLVEKFGEPVVTPAADYDKVNHEWVLVIGARVVTIYDYKEDLATGNVERWHIGGYYDDQKGLRCVKNLADVLDYEVAEYAYDTPILKPRQ